MALNILLGQWPSPENLPQVGKGRAVVVGQAGRLGSQTPYA